MGVGALHATFVSRSSERERGDGSRAKRVNMLEVRVRSPGMRKDSGDYKG